MINRTFLLCLASFLMVNAACKHIDDPQKQEVPDNKDLPIVKEKWHWGNKEKQNGTAGYAQVVKAGNILYISGIPGSDLSPESIAGVYKSLGECLKAFGASPKDVVKETLYTTDIEAMKRCNDPRKAFYDGDYPAASWVQVSRLYEPAAKVEVDLVAHIGNPLHPH